MKNDIAKEYIKYIQTHPKTALYDSKNKYWLRRNNQYLSKCLTVYQVNEEKCCARFVGSFVLD